MSFTESLPFTVPDGHRESYLLPNSVLFVFFIGDPSLPTWPDRTPARHRGRKDQSRGNIHQALPLSMPVLTYVSKGREGGNGQHKDAQMLFFGADLKHGSSARVSHHCRDRSSQLPWVNSSTYFPPEHRALHSDFHGDVLWFVCVFFHILYI